MLITLNPSSIHPPFARYVHGMAIPADARIVTCSGQLGISREGLVPEGVEAQARLCFEAIAAILGEADMTLADVARVNAYVTAREHLPGYMRVRDAAFGAHQPASTLMIVAGFARPEFLVEVEVLAAAR